MPRLVQRGDPGIDLPVMIDGRVLTIMPRDLNAPPEPISVYLDMLDGGAREFQRRPGFDGVADYQDRYTFRIPYDRIRGNNREQMELIRVTGGLHRVVLWRMVPVIFTCKAGVQRYYFPRFRKCAAWVYDGQPVGSNYFASTESFPSDATLNDADLTVTYAEGPALVSPSAGGMVIARQPDVSGSAMDYTALLIGDAVATGDKLIVWSCFSFECSMRAPEIRMTGQNESHAYTFVEV